MADRIDFTPAARRQFRKLAPESRKRLASLIDSLATEPRSKGATKLSGLQDLYRLRHGDYLIIYKVHDDRLLVLVIRIGHRRIGIAACVRPRCAEKWLPFSP